MTSFRKTQQDFKRDFEDKMAKLVFATHADIVANTPVDTGRLRSSIVVETERARKNGVAFGDSYWIIGTSVPYAEQVEVGMEPTVIRPKNAKALKFEIGGKTIFAKKVNHPGFKGRHMFQRAIANIESNAKRIFR